MITGIFDPSSGSPLLRCSFALPDQGIEGGVTFLVDTGADLTTIMPDDCRILGINVGKMSDYGAMVGIGGTINTVVAHAILTFHDDDKVRRSSYDVMVDFVANEPSADGLPSILGRDVLNRWRMDYDPTNNKLEFSVHSADLMI